MPSRLFKSFTAVAIAGASVAPARADDKPDLAAEVAALKAQVQSQAQEIKGLRRDGDAAWLDERRAEEVKGLVREVLADADTRASLLESSTVAGYDRGFFVGSADGNNLLKFNVVSQTRYVYNHRDRGPSESDRDENENGFQQRRTQLNFSGHVFDPKWTYRLRLSGDAEGATFRYDWAYIGYQFTDAIGLQVGSLKPQFLREEIIGADKQLAVERSYFNDYFTIDFTQGAVANYWQDRLGLYASVHDGSYAGRTDFQSDRTNLAFSGRAEYVLVGEADLYRQRGWKQLGDLTSWNGEETAVLIGAAADYEIGEEGTNTQTPDVLKYTADVQAEFGGVNLFAAFVGQQFDDNDEPEGVEGFPSDLGDANQLGFVVQGGVFVIPDKFELFARYEYIDFDGVYYRNDQGSTQSGSGNLDEDVFDDLSIVTVGGNYYLNKNNAKLTIDVLWLLDPVPASNSGAGILASPDEDQVVLRGQFTLAF